MRVVSNIVGAMQFKRTQREAGAAYEVVQATSLKDAEIMLDGKSGQIDIIRNAVSGNTLIPAIVTRNERLLT